MKVLIIGSGKTIFFLSRIFTAKGHKVVIINKEREECVQMSRQLSASIICGDGSDEDVLQEAGADSADAVLAITPNDQDNLIICQMAKIRFTVPKTIALANDPDNIKVFEHLGVTAFSTVQIIGNIIESKTSFEQIMSVTPVGENKVNITEIILDSDCPVVGKLLKNIPLPENALIAVITRDNKSIVPRGNDCLIKNDKIVLITLPDNHGQVMKIFTGEAV